MICGTISTVCVKIICGYIAPNHNNSVGVNKSAHARIVISTLQIIQSNLFIVVVTTVSEGVNGCNLAIRRVKFDFRYTPSIIGN